MNKRGFLATLAAMCMAPFAAKAAVPTEAPIHIGPRLPKGTKLATNWHWGDSPIAISELTKKANLAHD
jgi:hypothetical protein